MSFTVLRPQIGTLLGTVSTIQEVSNVPKVKFAGYPAVHIVPSDNESDYETTTENVRTYAFNVRIFYETKDTSMEDAFSALEEVVDSVLDLFDQEDQKSSSLRVIGVDLPTGYTFLNIWSAPSFCGELPGEQLIMAQISIRDRISNDAT